MYRIFAFLFIAMLPAMAMAQQGEKIKCKVVDGETFKPVKYAVATVEGIKDTASRKGIFIIYIHNPVQVHLEAEGYEPIDINVQQGAGKNEQYLKMYRGTRRRHGIVN